MFKTVQNVLKMLTQGLESIQFTQKRDYGRYIPKSANQAAYDRWVTLGKRFRNSMNKVVGQNVKA